MRDTEPTPPSVADSRAAPAPQELDAYRPYLLRYALLQLRDRSHAEDAVQETLLAALESRAGFAGRSEVRTWLTGILKHKIIDQHRRAARETPLTGPDGEEEVVAGAWLPDGHWADMTPEWADPERSFEDRRFWEALEACIAGLPPHTARVFVMRELLEMDNARICQELGITATNCWVRLHRARVALRACLQARWFGAGT